VIEQRLPISFNPAYEISNRGEVWSIERVVIRSNGSPMTVVAKIIQQQLTTKGYHTVTLRDEQGRKRVFRVHRLVLEHFVGECPEGMEGCHGPAGKDDNSVGNLRWDTHSINQLDSVIAGTHNNARKTRCKRDHELTEDNVYIVPSTGSRQCRACVREVRGNKAAGEVISDYEIGA
jgi:hypothetical protein